MRRSFWTVLQRGAQRAISGIDAGDGAKVASRHTEESLLDTPTLLGPTTDIP
ncbi:MAG: hypothetical protein M3Y48_09500 [Actinomycetota bacterium]|nr:hypothetical protein [Actinomycetota bacterium]